MTSYLSLTRAHRKRRESR